jgi:uncharacterized membrane protein
MIDTLIRFLENKYVSLSGIIGLILGFLSDALDNDIAKWVIFAFISILFIFAIVNEYRLNSKFNKEVIHIPVVIKIGSKVEPSYVMNNLIEEIEKIENTSSYKRDILRFLKIDLDSFIYEFKGDIYDFDNLMDFSRYINHEIKKLQVQIGNKIEFHVAYYQKPSIGFLLGTIFKTENISVYQNNDYKNTFFKVFDINSRKYKENKLNNEFYTIDRSYMTDESDEILVVLNSSSHNVNINSDKLKNYSNFVKLTLNSNGTIPYEIDWVEHSQEIYTLLNELQIKYKHIVLVHAMPESLSLVLGMAIENYWNLTITQYNPKTSDYDEMYTMNQIKYFG